MQAGAERALNRLMTALAGASVLFGQGMLETGLTFDIPTLLVDDEIIDYVLRMLAGFKVDATTLSTDLIKEVGPFGTYLAEMNTFEHLGDLSTYNLMNRRNYDMWAASGKPDLYGQARERAKEILATHKQKNPLSPEQVKAIRDVLVDAEATPSPFLGAMAEKYDLPYYIREGKSNIRDDWNYAYSMADAEFVTIAHQDDMYCKNYGEELLKAAEKYPDMTVFTSDYAIVKNKKVITGDKMLWVKRLLRLPLRFHILCGLKWIKIMPLVLGNPICCPATTYSKKRLGEPFVQSEYQFALDWDHMVQLAGEKGRFICVEKPLIYYRVHEGATTNACIKDNRRAREEAEMFARFWPKAVVKLIMKGYSSAYKEYE